MIDKFGLGPVPLDEKCQQYPYKDVDKALQECEAYKKMLEKRFQNLPFGVRFIRLYNPYGESGYYEVAIKYDMDDTEHNDAMLFVESNLPETWDDDEVFDVKEEIA